MVIAAFFNHLSHAHGGPLGGQILFQHQPQTQFAELHRGAAHGLGIVIFHFCFPGEVARQRILRLLKGHRFATIAACRNGQHHFAAVNGGRQIKRGRTVLWLAEGKKRAVRQTAAGGAQRQFPLAQQRFIELQIVKTPGIGALRLAPLTQGAEKIIF